MVKLKHGFVLFQPWANEVVKGNLNLLIRSRSTNIRERVAVIASKGIDSVWCDYAPGKEIMNFNDKHGIIGSVEIRDCFATNINELQNEIIKLNGKKYWNYYPKYLIPVTKTGITYVWVLVKAKEWKKTKESEISVICWKKINIEDEK